MLKWLKKVFSAVWFTRKKKSTYTPLTKLRGTILENKLIALMDKKRRKSRAPINRLRHKKLIKDDTLHRESKRRVKQLVKKNKLDGHKGFDYNLHKEIGLIATSEIIGSGHKITDETFKNEKTIVDAWQKSDDHRRIMLNPRWKYVGIYIGTGKFRTKFFVCTFGK